MRLSKRSTFFITCCLLGMFVACRFFTRETAAPVPVSAGALTAAPSVPGPTRTRQVHATRAPTITPTPVPTEPPWTCESGSFTNRLNIMAEERTYNLHVPPDFARGMPLMINFHGYVSTAEDEEEYSGTSILADEEGFIVAYPQALHDPAYWNHEPGEEDVDIPFVRALIDSVEKHCATDPRRIYATGMSNGGGMANRVGCALSKRVAAIAPVAGAYGFFGECTPKRPLAVLAFHGTGDEVVPYEGSSDPLDKNAGVWPPIPYWAATWAVRNGCASRAKVVSHRNGILQETWPDCRDDVEVTLYTIEDGKHVWPGYEYDPREPSVFHASRIIWDFFKKYTLPEE